MQFLRLQSSIDLEALCNSRQYSKTLIIKKTYERNLHTMQVIIIILAVILIARKIILMLFR